MAKSSTFDNDLLKLIFNATAIANIAQNNGTSPLTNLYVALHTADPDVSGTQSTNEATYTSYARVAVVRTTSGWTVTGNSVSPVSNISFPACTGGTNTITHFSVDVASSGSTKILYSGQVLPSISVSSGITPVLSNGTTIVEN